MSDRIITFLRESNFGLEDFGPPGVADPSDQQRQEIRAEVVAEWNGKIKAAAERLEALNRDWWQIEGSPMFFSVREKDDTRRAHLYADDIPTMLPLVSGKTVE